MVASTLSQSAVAADEAMEAAGQFRDWRACPGAA
jgi:hypothetical protein